MPWFCKKYCTWIRTYFNEEKRNIKRVKILKSDSAKNLSGKFQGAFAFFGKYIPKQAVHHFFCKLHLNELPLRKLIKKGDIGAHLKDLSLGKSKLKPCENFVAVPNPNFYFIPPSVVKDLSNDQKLMYKLSLSVMSGSFDLGINWACWLTLAILILYYYTTMVNPQKN